MNLLPIITSSDVATRNRSLDADCRALTLAELLRECQELDEYRRRCENLYDRVRSLFFLYAIHRFHLPTQLVGRESGRIPYVGYEHMLNRRYPEALDVFLAKLEQDGPSVSLSSALGEAYHRLAFQTLADQVRRSVRTVRGNQWMFRTGHPADVPLRIHTELLKINPATGSYPILRERTAVRMDFSHSGWSDIFFLGMDYPEGAKVINASIDLAVRGRHEKPTPPIDCSLRVIDEPLLRLISIDLDAKVEIHEINEVFDFARDYLGLIKGAVIAAGLIPPGMEGCGGKIADVFTRMIGPGLGLEITSRVNDIPKGSRLAVSTNLLGRIRSPHRGSASDSGRMDRWFRWWLAGFRRCLARNQTDSGVRGRCGRSGVWRKSWSADAAASRIYRRRGDKADSPEAAGQSGPCSRRHGAECRPDSGDGHGEVSAAL